MLMESQFWISLLQIIWIDILLSGDNAVVIALACRSLPPRQKRWGIVLGAGAAIVLRALFATFVVYLLNVPFLKIVGGLLLLWIAVKLIIPEGEAGQGHTEGGSNLWSAIRTIVIADAVMSLDNVIAIAAAAHGSVVLLVLGLLISIPLIIFGSTLILRALERLPILISAGAALLGYIAGELLVSDPSLHHWVETEAAYLHRVAPWVGAILVVMVGHAIARRMSAQRRRNAGKEAGGTAPTAESSSSGS